ncbi:protein STRICTOSIDINE SYNTHASE-LIKE 2-like isoform X2 [Benincasa hispida]|uniref:protein STRICTOSIDINE SYNTHASE-LIKE 2-like isoform X2 n=1 Tax=Benincasa hispida TaxID=102211 RepID=UPI0019005947|nr:protein STRICTOSIDINE SYNTHASE-LIKE 2-like isoform X2 [Benincasa hispida]
MVPLGRRASPSTVPVADLTPASPTAGLSNGCRNNEAGSISPLLLQTGCEEIEKREEKEERCGRPLGLKFKDGGGGGDDLYIADAYMGLLRVGTNGGLAEKLDFQTQDDQLWIFDSLTFANGLDIDQLSGVIYFTDSSSHYQRRNFASAILSGDNTGRLMKYDPKTKQLTLLLGNLSFPNGVSLSKNRDFLLLAETTKCRILRYWLKTAKAGSYDVVAKLPGFPDNIKTSRQGGFWVGIHSRKRGLLRLILAQPWIGKALLKLPLNIERVHSCLGKWIRNGGIGMRLSEEGEVMEIIEGKGELKWKSISEVEEREDGVVWIGSINTPFAAKIKM